MPVYRLVEPRQTVPKQKPQEDKQGSEEDQHNMALLRSTYYQKLGIDKIKHPKEKRGLS